MTTFSTKFVMRWDEVLTIYEAFDLLEEHCKQQMEKGEVHPHRFHLNNIKSVREKTGKGFYKSSTSSLFNKPKEKEDEPPKL